LRGTWEEAPSPLRTMFSSKQVDMKNVARVLAFALAAAVSISVSPASAQGKKGGSAPVAGGNDEAAVQLLQSMEQKFSNVPSVSGALTQKLQQPDDTGFGEQNRTSQATFKLLKPRDFIIEETAPEKNVTLVTGGSMYRYVPKLKQATKQKISESDQHYLALGFGARTSEILALYKVKSANGGRSLELEPRNQKTAQFKKMTIDVSQELVPQRFTVTQSDGTRMELAINGQSLDFGGRVSARDFKPDFGDAQIVEMQ